MLLMFFTRSSQNFPTILQDKELKIDESKQAITRRQRTAQQLLNNKLSNNLYKFEHPRYTSRWTTFTTISRTEQTPSTVNHPVVYRTTFHRDRLSTISPCLLLAIVFIPRRGQLESYRAISRQEGMQRCLHAYCVLAPATPTHGSSLSSSVLERVPFKGGCSAKSYVVIATTMRPKVVQTLAPSPLRRQKGRTRS